MSSFSELTEFSCAVRTSDEEGLDAGCTCINPALLCAPTGDSIFEATVGDKQGMTVYHGGEASLPSHSHARTKASLAYVQQEPQPNLPNFLTYEVSIAWFPHDSNAN